MLGLSNPPIGWRMAKLGDVSEIAFSGVDKKKIDGEIPIQLCNYTDVFYNRLIRPEIDFMKATATPRECKRWGLRRGDVLFTKDSETPDEIGIAAYVTENMPNVLCGYHLGMARPRTGVLDGKFLTEALGSQASRREFARIANGITRFGLTLDSTRSLPILLPPLSEQRAIAAVLDAINETIEHIELVISATECLGDALLHELLTRGIPGWHNEWREVPGLGTLPRGWRIAKLGDLAEVVMGQSPPSRTVSDWDENERHKDGLPFIQGNAEFASAHPEPKKWCNEPLKVAEFGDTLISVRAPVGETNRANRRIAIGRGLAAIRFSRIHSGFGWYFVNHAKPEFMRVAQGSTFYAIGRDDLNGLTVALPPLAEQQAIARVLDSNQLASNTAKSACTKVALMKVAIADALLSGRIRPPPNDD
ncbi:MAG: restriction endonuclease subunit S [Chloroflexota bacterium]|nr:restriction endonuclease subunit S [Chloroflexota bacterium]